MVRAYVEIDFQRRTKEYRYEYLCFSRAYTRTSAVGGIAEKGFETEATSTSLYPRWGTTNAETEVHCAENPYIPKSH